MYNLDLTTVLQLMQSHHHDVTLQAEVHDLPATHERGSAQVVLVRGKVVSCQLMNNSGVIVLAGKDALQFLAKQGALKWTFAPTETSQPAAPPSEQAVHPISPAYEPDMAVPHRLVEVAAPQLKAWPRAHRAFYILVDGERNIARIASMLALPLRAVEELAQDLRSKGIIT